MYEKEISLDVDRWLEPGTIYYNALDTLTAMQIFFHLYSIADDIPPLQDLINICNTGGRLPCRLSSLYNHK